MSADTQLPQDGPWRLISEALHELRFGAVTITVHHGRIVQIERSEKLRLDKPCNAVSSITSKDILVDRVSANRRPSGNPDPAE